MEANYGKHEITHLFWTGGWDSTFRLMQLLFLENKTVQPHYIITAQESVGVEIRTMLSIRGKLTDKYPEMRKRLKPIVFFDVRAIEKNERITEEYKRIKNSVKINYQYEFLARYCEQFNLQKVELCIFEIRDDRTYFGDDSLFSQYYSYPLLGFTKKKMADISKGYDWNEFMYMTWFCRLPKKGKPCGMCGPCTDAFVYGFGKRIPLKARIIGRLQLPFRKFWRNNYKLQSNKFFKIVARSLEGKY